MPAAISVQEAAMNHICAIQIGRPAEAHNGKK